MYRDKEALTREAKGYLEGTGGRYPNGQTQEGIDPLRTAIPTARSRVPAAGARGPHGPQHLPGKPDRRAPRGD